MKQMLPQFVIEALQLQPVLRDFKKEYSTTFMNSAREPNKERRGGNGGRMLSALHKLPLVVSKIASI